MRLVCGTCGSVQIASSESEARCVDCDAVFVACDAVLVASVARAAHSSQLPRAPRPAPSATTPPSSSKVVPQVGRSSRALPAPPGDRWYVLTKTGQQGPYSAEEFAWRLEHGELAWTLLVWRQGLQTWRPARRDELLVMAVAGTLGLGSKTTRVDGLQSLLHAQVVPEAPSDWLTEDVDDTRVEAWPLAMQLRPTQFAGEVARPSEELRLGTGVLSRPVFVAERPSLPAQRTRARASVNPPAREVPTGRYARSSAVASAARRGHGVLRSRAGAAASTWVALVAFAAGALVAVLSGRIAATSNPALDESPASAAPPPEPVTATPQTAAGLGAVGAARRAGSLATTTPTSVEIVTRALPAPEEVRSELRRIEPSLRRCLGEPARALDIELAIDGKSGRVQQLEMLGPGLTPGRSECAKEALSDLRVAPFVRPTLRYKYRFAW